MKKKITVLGLLLLSPVIAAAAQPRLHFQNVATREGDAGALTAVSVLATLDSPAPVRYALYLDVAGGGADTQRSSQPIVFEPGQSSATGEILVKGDDVAEVDEIYFLTFEAASPQAPQLAGPSTICILNDDVSAMQNIRLNVGDSISIPLALGNYFTADSTLEVTPDQSSSVALTPSATPGSPEALLKIDALSAGETVVTARVEKAGRIATGTITISVFQPSVLVARPEAVQLRDGEEMTLRIALTPAASAAATVTAQPETAGVVAIVNPSAEAPVDGMAVFQLRGLAAGKTKLIIDSPGRQLTTVVPVEVAGSVAGRRRAAKP